LATLAGRLTDNHDKAAFRLLESGRAALTARLALAERAEHSLDLQYYIYRNDTSGRLLTGALLHAADRGVRVRLLLDDMYVGKDEARLIGLDAHPNVEVRLYNPFRVRGDNPLGKAAEFLGDKDRLNRRMHNKLLIADNQLAITGGRNIGDEYFQVEGELAFRDLDVLAAGRVVQAMSAGFDAYWNSAAAVPARAMPKPRARDLLLAELRNGLEWNLAEIGQDALFRFMGMDVLGLATSPAGVSPWWPGRAEFLFDPPEKADDTLGVAELPSTRLLLRGLDAKDELLIASPYFIPGRLGLDLLTYLRHRGTRVRVLTNSLAANDVAIVHAGYARYRLPLLLAGIELHELKRAKVSPELRTSLASGASRTSLHSKVLVFDRASAYIGSMNLDPRSVLINTEAGLIIHSPGLAGHVAGLVEEAMAPANSYRLRAQPMAEQADNPLLWSEERNGQAVSHDREPGTSAWQRWLIDLLAELPIEDDL
jgi:putative cardiolipin synthase